MRKQHPPHVFDISNVVFLPPTKAHYNLALLQAAAATTTSPTVVARIGPPTGTGSTYVRMLICGLKAGSRDM
eukprot:CAMPEP_0172776888 /NCGR_PEP_ID=MMETSP1074-20121228/200775_1 /TAXON_ID=2916 /ORGANISM="Ceratium fusus, Strain PA161109" /LENGTH=71 /DNA_ID=CAMNT_0013613743 /DNA_START=200 /DNA_END=416 /DNA_ORIENTATION=+